MNNQSNVTITELYKVIIYHHASLLLILTLDQAVTQYGQLLFGIFNLSIVTGKLSIKIWDIHHVPVCLCLTVCYPLHNMATARRVHLPSSTYLLGDKEETGGLPGTKKSTKYREEIFVLNYLNLLLTKRIMIIPDVYLFMPVNLSF